MAKEYLDDLYNWVSKADDSFSERYSPKKFKENMQGEDYSSQMFDWISNTDETFKDRYTRESFQDKVKKKGESQRISEEVPTESDTEQEEGLTGSSDALVDDKRKRKKKKFKKKQQYKKTTGIRVTKDRGNIKEGGDEGATDDEDIKAEQVVKEPVEKKKDKKKEIREQNVAEVVAYADKKKNKKLQRLLVQVKAIANTVEGRLIDKKNKYPDFSIESLEDYISDVKTYKEKAVNYETARQLVKKGTMSTTDFQKRYEEGGWGEVDPDVRKLSAEEVNELRDEWDKKVIVDKDGNIKYTPERFARIDNDEKFKIKKEEFQKEIRRENIIDLAWDGDSYNFSPEDMVSQIESLYGDMGIRASVSGDKVILNSEYDDEGGLTIDFTPLRSERSSDVATIMGVGGPVDMIKGLGDFIDWATGSSDEFAKNQITAIEDFIVSKNILPSEGKDPVSIMRANPAVFQREDYEKLREESNVAINQLVEGQNKIVQDYNELEALIKEQKTPPTLEQMQAIADLVVEHKENQTVLQEQADIQKEINLALGISTYETIKVKENLGTVMGALGKKFVMGVEDIISGGYTLLQTLDATLDEQHVLILEGIYKDDPEALKVIREQYKGRAIDRKRQLKLTREGLEGFLVDPLNIQTEDAFTNNPKNSLLFQGAMGVMQSLPAMLFNIAGPIPGIAAMGLQIFDGTAEEWVNNPNYENMPLHDLLIVGGFNATIQAILERLGLKTIFSKTPLGSRIGNRILNNVYKKVGKKAPIDVWVRALNEETNSLVKNGVIRILGGTLVEGVTGGGQEITDLSIKGLYNKLNGGSVFELPKTFQELIERVGKGAVLEAIGGALMTTTMTIPKIMTDGIQSVKMNRDMLELLHFMSSSPDLQVSMVKTLKMEILKGRMSKEDAQYYMNQFKEMVSVMEEIPGDIDNKADAFDLIVEYNKLDTEIKNKNKNLVSNQKARMKEIEEELDALLEQEPQTKTKQDAISEPSTESVDVQESPRDSKTVGEGDVRPVTETQETTEEVQDEAAKTEKKEVSLADKIREGKLKDKGTMSTLIPIQVWDTALEGVAITVETIQKVINKVKKSKWYKGLDVKTRSEVDQELQGMKDALERGEEVTDPRQEADFPGERTEVTPKDDSEIKENLELKEKSKQRDQSEKEGEQEYIEEVDQRKAEGEKGKLNVLEGKLQDLEVQLITLTEENPYYQIAENMDKITPESARNETGGKVGTNQDISPGLTSKKGVSVEKAAENLGNEGRLRDALGSDHGFSDQDIRDEIIDILLDGKQAYQNKILGDIRSEIKETKAQIKEAKQNIKKKKTRARVSFGKKKYKKITGSRGRVKFKTKKKTDPPSPKKIIGTPKDKKVTVKEKAALKDQIKMESNAARDAVKSYKAAAKNLVESINKLAKGGKISAKKAEAMIKKVLSTNLLNSTKVKELQEYIEKSFDEAVVEDKLAGVKGKRERALKNLKGKVTAEKSLLSLLKELFKIDPSLIPESQLDSYIDLLEQFGKREKELRNLAESAEVTEQATAIINSIIEENQVPTEVSELNEKNTLEELQNALQEAKDEAVKSRLKFLIDEKIKSNEKVEKEGRAAIKSIKKTKIDLKNVLDFTDAQMLANDLNNLTDEDIEGLVVTNKDGTKDYTLVKNLLEVKENMNKGYTSALANEIKNTVEANRSKRKIKKVVDVKTKRRKKRMLFSTIYGALKKPFKGTSLQEESLRGTMTTAVDDMFGNFNDKTIYDNTFGKLAKAYSAYQADLKFNVTDKLEKATKLLSQGLLPTTLKSVKAVRRAKYLVQTYRLQREFESNPGNKQVASALDFINETIKSPLTKPLDKKILQEIKEEYTVDGEIDMNKIEKNFTPKQKAALKLIDEASDMEQKALWTAQVIRGTGISPLNNYVHHQVLMDKDQEADDYTSQQRKISNPQPSTKSQALVTRTKGAKPINFDPISSTKRGAALTLLDFHVTDAVRVVNNTVRELTEEFLNDPNSTKNQQESMKALEAVLREVNKGVFEVSLATSGPLSKVINEAIKWGYRATLGSIPRAAAEMISNFNYAISNPKNFGNAMKNFAQFSVGNQGFKTMMALKSRETMKNYGGQTLTSKMIDAGLVNSSNTMQQKEHLILEQLSRMTQFGPKQIRLISETVADGIITAPDKIFSRPLWFGSFARSFKASTGVQLTAKDMQEIGDGTSKYLGQDYKDAREKATAYADQESVKMANSRNPFNVIPKTTITSEDRAGKDAVVKIIYKSANAFLASFALNEYVTARNATLNLLSKGEISRSQAAATLAGAISRMGVYVTAYTYTTSLFNSALGWLLGDTEDEKEEDYQKERLKEKEDFRVLLREEGISEDDIEKVLEERFPTEKPTKETDYWLLAKRQLVGSMLTLITQRGLGNIPRSLISFAIEEYLNKPYLGGLRQGEDPVEILQKQLKEREDLRVLLREEGISDSEMIERVVEERLGEEPELQMKEYNSFTDALTFNMIRQEDLENKSLVELLAVLFSGPAGPVTKVAQRSLSNIQRMETSTKETTKEKYKNRLINISALQALGNMGYIPLYKDINKYLSQEYYKKEKRWKREEKIEKEQEEIMKAVRIEQLGEDTLNQLKKYHKGLEERMRQEVEKMKEEGASKEEIDTIKKRYNLLD